MFDLPYILSHPLLAAIYKRHAELGELAAGLAEGSAQRKAIDKRIATLEQCRLPKPTLAEQRTTPIVDQLGTVIGQVGSLRKRHRNSRRGRPDEVRIRVRAAFEDKIAHPEWTWRAISEKRGFKRIDLERQVRLLKAVLKREGIAIPQSTEYHEG